MDKDLKARIQENKLLTSQERKNIIEDLEKLEKIEQIYRQWAEIGDDADCWAFREIRAALEQDN